jgi:D-glycero-D-manno-heptose 1,7-bisphosphate phosphatase
MGINPLVEAVFLDRDGVLNHNVFYEDTGSLESPRTVADFELYDDTIPSLRKLQDAGLTLFLVSNQPNIAKGKSTLSELYEVQRRFACCLDQAHILFQEFYYCFHHPESNVPEYGGQCQCRKPSPLFLFRAARDYGIDLSQSWMVGDRLTDVECGKRAGVHTILVLPEPNEQITYMEPMPDSIVRTLSGAVDEILWRRSKLVPQYVRERKRVIS